MAVSQTGEVRFSVFKAIRKQGGAGTGLGVLCWQVDGTVGSEGIQAGVGSLEMASHPARSSVPPCLPVSLCMGRWTHGRATSGLLASGWGQVPALYGWQCLCHLGSPAVLACTLGPTAGFYGLGQASGLSGLRLSTRPPMQTLACPTPLLADAGTRSWVVDTVFQDPRLPFLYHPASQEVLLDHQHWGQATPYTQ